MFAHLKKESMFLWFQCKRDQMKCATRSKLKGTIHNYDISTYTKAGLSWSTFRKIPKNFYTQ